MTFVIAAVLAMAAAQSPEMQLTDGAVRVAPAAGGVLSLYAGPEGAPAMLGQSRVEDGGVVFRPRYPFQPGLTLRAVYVSESGQELRREFTVPRAGAHPAARVQQVYPTAARLPQNLLKLYVYFTQPMARGEAYRRIRLLDRQGKPVEAPFLELDQELWDAAGKRLTVFFDPGRIKRGLLPNQQAGLPLREGQTYTLWVEAGWPDAQGQPLEGEFRKTFSVVASDRESPSVSQWRITAPSAGSSEPLTLDLPEPMDHALLLREMEVTRDGARVPGEAALEAGETRWTFRPSAPWEKGAYVVEAAAALEDLAGNRLDRLFDVDNFDPANRQRRGAPRRIPFQVR